MKNFTKLLLILLTFALILALPSCGELSPNETPNETPSTGETEDTETIDRTNPSAGTYKIQFKLGANTVIHYYNAGETITPPDTLPTYETSRSYYKQRFPLQSG